MVRPRSKIDAVCQNPDCGFYRKEKGKNITKQGENSAGHQRFKCWHCNRYFVETKGGPLYNKKLSERKIVSVCKELVETKGIRATERTTGVHRDTIGHLLEDLAIHADSLHGHLVKGMGLSAYELDELFTVIKKSKRKLSADAICGLSRAKRQSSPA